MDIHDTGLSPNTRFNYFLHYRGVKRVSKYRPHNVLGDGYISDNLHEVDPDDLHGVGETDSDIEEGEEREAESDFYGVHDVGTDEDEDGPWYSRWARENEEDSDSELYEHDDLGVFDVGSREVVDFISQNDDNTDADMFYLNRRESFTTGSERSSFDSSKESDETELICSDDNVEYKLVDKHKDRRYSNNSNDRIELVNKTLAEDGKFPTNSQTAFKKWEMHDERTLKEIYGNRGIYDEFHPDLSTLENVDPSRMLRRSPAEKFRDSVKLKHLNIKKLFAEGTRRYKNNISTIVTDVSGNDYLVLACTSELLFFEINNVTHIPNTKPVLRFDCRPSVTSTTDRLISTWPRFPHTINFLKSYDDFNGKSVLGACLDDGTLMIWYVETIIKHIEKFVSMKQPEDDNYHDNRFFGLKIHCDLKIKMEASLWGLDFLSYNDDGQVHNLIIASDNSQSITLFYYDPHDRQFYHVKSHQILHNIPEVSFIEHKIQADKTHDIRVSCVSISAELLVFNFKFRLNQGPIGQKEYEHYRQEHMYYIDPAMSQFERSEAYREDMNFKRFQRVIFLAPNVITRALLGEDCWTAKPISTAYFHEVKSICAVFGDSFIDEDEEVKHIINESTILDLLFDPVKTSHLGIAANWQFFETPVTSLSAASSHHESVFESAKLTGVDDEYRRVNKGLSKVYRDVKSRESKVSLNENSYRLDDADQSHTTLLAVSTSKRVGLFRSDTLFCNAATKRIFDLLIPFNDASEFADRISITHLIPQLSCFIALTQQGLVTIMRLCVHRGVYGMRQEHIFPNALSLVLGYNGYRTISGLAVRDRSPSKDIPRFLLYLTYTDGLVVVYEVTKNDDEISLASI